MVQGLYKPLCRRASPIDVESNLTGFDYTFLCDEVASRVRRQQTA